jgi:DNA helicase-2/ATP-dependent DNA helicase PcrA
VRLMKDVRPEGNAQIQEERRLCYVAMTRAQRRLTLSTVINRRKNQSAFLEDILEKSEIQEKDLQRLEPKLEPPGERSSAPPRAYGNGRAGAQIGEWSLTCRPRAHSPLELSDTSIERYASCPLQYLYQNGWGLRSMPGPAQTFGSVMHRTVKKFVEAWKEGNRLEFAEVETQFHADWRRSGFEDKYQEEEYRREGLEQLRAFHEWFTAHPDDVLMQEREFTLPLENDVVVNGRMDQVNRLAGDQVEILDYKTGRPKTPRKAEEDLQLSLYLLAARDAMELNPAQVTYHNLMNNERVRAARDAKQLQKALDKVQSTAQSIRSGSFDAAPGFGCRFCDFRALCPAHEQEAVPAPPQPADF